MRRVIVVIALAIVAAACGSSDDATSPTLAPAPTVGAEGGSSTSPTAAPDSSAAPAVPADAPLAPDFTLALGDGGEFTLSGEQKPVYMVFWAEW